MKGRGTYPAGWDAFARQLKDAENWTCIRCGRPHDPKAGYCLTVHHWLMDKAEPFEHWWAFLVLCQRCHLHIQAKVKSERPWIFGHSDWFKPYAAGFYAFRYLNQTLTRGDVLTRLDELLALEAMATIGREPVPLDVALRRSGAAELPGIDGR